MPPTSQEIDERIARFRSDLKAHTPASVLRRHITFGSCLVLDDDSYCHLKEAVAGHFGVHPNEVLIVGSAKLGFSIAPKKTYRHFGDASDIDVAIVSAKAFDDVWIAAWEYALETRYWPESDGFKQYLFEGWVRPDKLPNFSFHIKDHWFEFFRDLTKSEKYGPFKISGGLYRTWRHLEAYQMQCVSSCGKTS